MAHKKIYEYEKYKKKFLAKIAKHAKKNIACMACSYSVCGSVGASHAREEVLFLPWRSWRLGESNSIRYKNNLHNEIPTQIHEYHKSGG